MADVSSIQLPNGSIFDFKDTFARDSTFSLLGNVIAMSAGDNLDDYQTPGNYYCASSSMASDITNSPGPSAFKLVVIQLIPNAKRFMQIAFMNPATSFALDNPVMLRTYRGLTWSEWISIRDSAVVNGHTVKSDVPANAVFTDTTYTPASEAPLMDNTTSAVGTSEKYAREDHVHPRDSKVFSLVEPTNTIPEGADLNSYYVAGTYICQGNAVASTLLHTPVTNNAFSLVVIRLFASSVRAYQLLFVNSVNGGANNATIYFRYRSTVWSEWFDIRDPSKVNGHTVESDVPAGVDWPNICDMYKTNLSFVYGSIASASGANASDTNHTRARTNDYLSIADPGYGFDIDIPETFRLYVYFYDEAKTMTGKIAWVSGYQRFDGSNIPANSKYVRFVGSTSDNTAFELDDIPSMYFRKQLYKNDVYLAGDTYTPKGPFLLSGFYGGDGTIGFSFTLPKCIGDSVSSVAVNTLKIRVCRSSGYLSGYTGNGADVTTSDYTVAATVRADNIVHVTVKHNNFTSLSLGETLSIYVNSVKFTFS